MDKFELIIDKYKDVSIKEWRGINDCLKILLGADLAEFEIKWILQCLFTPPIDLPSTLSEHKHIDAWNHVIGDTFMMITDMMQKWNVFMDEYVDSVVDICLKTYAPHVRKRAIQCITMIVRSGLNCLLPIEQYIIVLNNVEETLSCRVPLYELLGVICKEKPDLIINEREIWVTFKSGLDNSKLTDSLTSGILSGIDGFLEHFGLNVPIIELNDLYERMTLQYIRKRSLVLSCLNVISSHASLFSEKIIMDVQLKEFVWNLLQMERQDNLDVIYKCLQEIYSLIFVSLNENRDAVNKLVMEIYNYTLYRNKTIQRLSYKILSTVIKQNKSMINEEILIKYNREILDASSRVIFDLEQRILAPKAAGVYDTKLMEFVDKACWLAVDGHSLSDALYRIIILSYTHVSKPKVIVHALLNSDTNRTSAVMTLINISIQSEESISQYINLWDALFNSNNGTDADVIEKSCYVYNEVNKYIIYFMEYVLEEQCAMDFEEAKTKLSLLFNLTSKIIQMENVYDWLLNDMEYVLCLIMECICKYGAVEGAVMVVTVLIKDTVTFEVNDPMINRLSTFYSSLRIEMCNSESMLCVSCLALISAPVSFIKDIQIVLDAYSLILNRKDVDAKLFVKIIDSFERLLELQINNIDTNVISEILMSIDKLRSTIDTTDKHGRILRRKILLLFGKYSSYVTTRNEYSKLKLRHLKELTLNIPNCIDGDLLKLHLANLIHLSIKEDDFNNLYNILVILCANSDTIKKQHDHERVIIELIVALCRCLRTRVGVDKMADIERAIKMFNSRECGTLLVEYITHERSPGVRSLLCELLSVICNDDVIIQSVFMQVELMYSSEACNKMAALELMEAMITSLKKNNELTKIYLPKILILILKTNERSLVKTYSIAKEYFVEKLELFTLDEIRNLCLESLKNNLSIDNDVFEIQTEKTVNMIRTTRFDDYDSLINVYSDCRNDFWKKIYVLSKMTDFLDFTDKLKRKIIMFNEFLLLNEVENCVEKLESEEKDEMIIFKSLFLFLEVYCDVILEMKYKYTLRLLSSIISKISYFYMKDLFTSFYNCYNKFMLKLKNTPEVVIDAISLWFYKLTIDDITKELRNDLKKDTIIKINAIKLFLKVTFKRDDLIHYEFSETIKNWADVLLEMHLRGIEVESYKMAALNDVISVSILFIDQDEIVSLITKGQKLSNEVTFCQKYIRVMSDLLIDSSVLTYGSVKPFVTNLVYDVLKYNAKRNFIDNGQLFEFVEKYWPTIQATESPSPLRVLTELNKCSPKVRTEGSCLKWLRNNAEQLSIDVLFNDLGDIVRQCGDMFSDAIKKFSAMLPLRLSEFTTRSDPRLFTTMLDALANTGNLDMLHILYCRVIAKDTTGWWDEAIDKCMSKLATRHDINLSLKLYDYMEKCQVMTTRTCEVLLVPLLRYSTSKYNEEFFSRTLKNILEKLRRTVREPTANMFNKLLNEYNNSFLLLQILFEKVSTSSLESPNSMLHKQLKITRTWYLPAEVCSICMTLRKQCRVGNDEESLNIYNKFQCNNYNTMVAALCKKRPLLKFYEVLFHDDVWELIVDCNRDYDIDIGVSALNTKRHTVSSHMENVASNSLGTSRTLRTTRTLFLGTLSDNPMKYDLLQEDEVEEQITQEVHLRDNALNSHPCTAVISLLLSQLSNLTDDEQPFWVCEMAEQLTNEAPRNIKWFLAQIIINTSEDMSKYSSTLTPALWFVIMKTTLKINEKQYLNGLHCDIIKSIIKWSSKQPSQPNKAILEKCLELIINTCYHYKNDTKVLSAILNMLIDYVKMYGDSIDVKWEMFDVNSDDLRTKELTIELLLKITRNKVCIPEVLDYAINQIQRNEAQSKVKEVSEMFGLTLTMCQSNVKFNTLKKFRECVKEIRKKDVFSFIKVIYYVSMGTKDVLDDFIFSNLTYLAPKQPQVPKIKCYTLLSKYLSLKRERDENIVELFNTINLAEMLTEKDADIAVSLAQNGYHLMDASMQKQMVILINDVIVSGNEKWRRAGYMFFLKAFQESLKSIEEEPLSKKKRLNTPSSKIIKILSSDDGCIKLIYSNLGKSLLDNTKVYEEVYNGVLMYLCVDDIGIRFCEIIVLLLVLPSKMESSNTVNMASMNAGKAISVANKMLLQVIRDNDNYKKKLLRDMPLRDFGISNTNIQSKLLTMSKTYQGTFRSNVSKKPIAKTNVDTSMNVQIPIDDILKEFLQFGETNIEVGTTIFMELYKIIMEKNGDVRKTVAAILSHMFDEMKFDKLTSLFISMARLIVYECSCVDGFEKTIRDLVEKSKGSEAECLFRLLHEELNLQTESDIKLTQPEIEFDSTSTKLSDYMDYLSNWDDIPMQIKKDFNRRPIRFWYDDGEFPSDCDSKFDWVSKMADLYRGTNCNKWNLWLRDIENWPRRPFCISAAMRDESSLAGIVTATGAAMKTRSLLSVVVTLGSLVAYHQITEAYTSQSVDKENGDWLKTFTNINERSCPAQWAVRLMLRHENLKDLNNLNLPKYELDYVKEMNRRTFTTPALQCIQRNISKLNEAEQIPWYIEQCESLRIINSNQINNQLSVEMLEKCEFYEKMELKESDRALLNNMKFKLKFELNLLQDIDITTVINDIAHMCDTATPHISNINDIMIFVIDYYIELFDKNTDYQHMKGIIELLNQIIRYDSTNVNLNMYFCTYVHYIGRLDETYRLEAYQSIFEILNTYNIELNDIIIEELRSIAKWLPNEMINKYYKLMNIITQENNSTSMLKLIRCPSYALENYCTELLKYLKDNDCEKWRETMTSVYECIFDIKDGGAEYILMNKYKQCFNDIRQFKETNKFKTQSDKLLKETLYRLRQRHSPDVLSLHDLCPSLAQYSTRVSEKDRKSLEILLRVPSGCSVVRFEDNLHIFKNSIKRPLLLRAVLSNGTRTGYLIKQYEDLRTDWACQNILKEYNKITKYKGITYTVTPLGSDGGVIQYLENNITIRGLLTKYYEINDLSSGRVRDTELILQPMNAALSHFRNICNKLPTHSIRSSISNECETINEFICKKNNFLDTIAVNTIWHWILGIGDRHLENILYNNNTGCVCSIDWASIFEHAVYLDSPELIPARLSRCVLAVIQDIQVLESRLQSVLSNLRQNYKVIICLIHIAFKWRSDYNAKGFQNTLKSIESKLKGSVLPCDITKSVLLQSKINYKEKYIDVLNNIMDIEQKDIYSIEEQVYSLLKQCTNENILSVTRMGWEPWI